MASNGTHPRNTLLMAGTLLTVVVAAAPAHADLKIVSEVSVTRSSPASQGGEPETTSPMSPRDSSPPGATQTSPRPTMGSDSNSPSHAVTTYYKGNQARVESADGTVTIYDLKAGKVYTLRPAERTYHVTPLQNLLEPSAELSGRSSRSGRMQLESKVDLKEDKAAGKKTIAGREAICYTLTGSTAVRRSSGGGFGRGGFPGGRRFPRGGRFPGGGFPGGGFPGGFPFQGFPGGGFPGGFPGGGYPGGDREPGGDSSGAGRGAGRRGMPSVQMSGDYWIAAPLAQSSKVRDPLLPTVAECVPAGPFLRPLADKLSKLKGFPVASKVTVTTTAPRSQTSSTVTTTTEVKSISEDPLDAQLFTVPDGYKEVETEPVIPSP